MTKSADHQNEGMTGDLSENTTPDIPTPDGTSELQSGNVIGADGQAPSVSGGGESRYEGNTSAVSMEVDEVAQNAEDAQQKDA